MTSYTPTRIPYVDPDDTLVDYPATSRELAEAITAGAWVPLPLLGGFEPLGGAYAPPAYAIDCLGFVHLRGTITYPTAGSPANVQLAIVPPCPDGSLFWGQLCSGPNPCRVELYPTGALNVVGPIPDGPGCWLSLTGISYHPAAIAAQERPA